jgi:hypothetical protein
LDHLLFGIFTKGCKKLTEYSVIIILKPKIESSFSSTMVTRWSHQDTPAAIASIRHLLSWENPYALETFLPIIEHIFTQEDTDANTKTTD